MKTIKIYFSGDTDYKTLILDCLKEFNLKEVDRFDSNVDIYYRIYGMGPSFGDFLKIWLPKKPFIINHWIGTDVLTWYNKINNNSRLLSILYYKFRRYFLNRKEKKGFLLNLAGTKWLRDELKSIEIESKVLPITTINDKLIENFNKEHKKEIDFLTYIPSNRFDFYGGEKIIETAKLLSHNIFYIIQPDLNNIPDNTMKNLPSNVKMIPKISYDEMQDYIQKSRCFIRLTKHDGLSLSVIEALLSGLQVVWTHKHPYTRFIDYSSSLEILIETLKDSIKDNKPNVEGRDYVINNYHKNIIKKKYSSMFEDIVQKIIL